ncbi:MAG: DNA double-strand break repair nuclease NurA, partial [Actinomycetota bacterium]|nr:DNA double-strand break repair nuclease NurA [Actinomycetota bacterium]
MDEEPTHIEVQESHDEEEALRIETALSEKGFHLLSERTPAQRVAAVDGGSFTVANGRSFVIGALRVGGCIFKGDVVTEEILSPLKMVNISRATAQALYTKTHVEATGKIPKAFPSHDDMLGRLRTMEEWMLAREVLKKLSREDVLLIDGSLKASMSVPHGLIRSICEEA